MLNLSAETPLNVLITRPEKKGPDIGLPLKICGHKKTSVSLYLISLPYQIQSKPE
jgi:hypothetical protein